MKTKPNKHIILWAVVIIAAAAILFFIFQPKKAAVITAEYQAKTGSIKVSVSTTGTVMPQNRLEIKPALSGRMESILVVEGQKVRRGQTLAYMSSSDRAALLDAARAQGEKSLKEWEDIYKPIPFVAPINGEVIVRAVEPGQTVSPADAVIVLSDRLIIQAQVDETDIGKVKVGQEASLTLDAYPDQPINGKVDHIYYESKTVNNVTMYYVDILPDKVPDFFRSGMSANIEIVQQKRDGVVLLPSDAIKKYGDKNIVLLKAEKNGKPERREVTTGLTDDENTEITSGLSGGETIVVMKQNYKAPQAGSQTVNPLMPQRPRNAGRAH